MVHVLGNIEAMPRFILLPPPINLKNKSVVQLGRE